MYDLVIVGGGPAAVAAGVYAARKKMATLLVAEGFGGQSIVSADIHNWIGEKSISGVALAERLEAHVRAYEPGIEIWTDRVESVSLASSSPRVFSVTTKKGEAVEARAVLVASGSRRKRLGVPGEDKLDGKGVAYCSICDAPLFGGKDVVVVGGGNAGLEAVVDLHAYAKTITLLQRSDALRGDPVTQEMIGKWDNVRIIFNAAIEEIVGDSFVSSVRYKDAKAGTSNLLAVEGVFVEIGSMPNSDIVKGFVDVDEIGRIKVDPRTGRASALGIWAAGDVCDGLYQQNNIAAGDAVRALLNIYSYLHSGK